MKRNPWWEYSHIMAYKKWMNKIWGCAIEYDVREILEKRKNPETQKHLLQMALGYGFTWYVVDKEGDINFCEDKNCKFTVEDYKEGKAWAVAGPYDITPWGKGPTRIRKLLSMMNHRKEKYKGEWL